MQIASDAPALRILDLQHVPGQTPERLLGPLHLRDPFMGHHDTPFARVSEPGCAELEPAPLVGAVTRILDPELLRPAFHDLFETRCDRALLAALGACFLARLQIRPANQTVKPPEAILFGEAPPSGVQSHDAAVAIENGDMRGKGVERGLKKRSRPAGLQLGAFAHRYVGGQDGDAVGNRIHIEFEPAFGLRRESRLEPGGLPVVEYPNKFRFDKAAGEGGNELLQAGPDQLPVRAAQDICRCAIAFGQPPAAVE